MTLSDSSEISNAYGHCNCLLCGDDNPIGLGLKFILLSDGKVHTSLRGRRLLQGYSGIIHGGVMCALLDAAMVHCLFHKKIKAVTADMNVRFHKPIPVNLILDLYGEMVSARKSLFYMKSEIYCNDELMVEGNARFMKIRENKNNLRN